MTEENRMEICKECPLYKEDPLLGPLCNKNLYISPDGTKATHLPKVNWKKGCGCKLQQKTSNPNAHCIINKW